MPDTTTIALIAAMPAEIKPILRRVGAWTKDLLPGGFPCYRFRLGERTCVLVESGMGPRQAGAATKAAIAAAAPDIIINIGFAGAVTAGPAVGDVVVARRLLCRHDRLFTEEPGISSPLLSSLPPLAAGRDLPFAVFQGTFVTTVEIASKKDVAARLPVGTQFPVLEMETAAVARVAAQAGVPLLGVRSISDAADEELGFAITDFTTDDFKLHLGKILLAVAKKPRLLLQLLRLARNSGRAGENLATATVALLKDLYISPLPLPPAVDHG